MAIEMTEQATNGPAAMEFMDYARSACQRLRELLDQKPDDEGEFQQFLETHPSFVPGARTSGGGTCDSRVLDLLVAQPELPGLRARKPDFMWLKATSDTWFPVLIEIEAPAKRIFRKDGGLLAKFTDARNQLAQWRTWFQEPHNQAKFQREYGVPSEWVERKTMRLHLILVYGRRREFADPPELSKHRGSLVDGLDQELMSFDRLSPDPLLSNALTVRACGPGRYSAVAVPPTLKTGPHGAERLLIIEGLDQAVDASKEISNERREFLKSRIAHWRKWAVRKPSEWIDALDME